MPFAPGGGNVMPFGKGGKGIPPGGGKGRPLGRLGICGTPPRPAGAVGGVLVTWCEGLRVEEG
jgi:hypothetical protein